jgi:hypothetical protein
MLRQNITLRLDRELICKAKVLASQQGTSVTALLTQHLTKILTDEEAYEAAHRRALTLLDQGFHLGGKSPNARDEWHEQ